LNVNGIDQKIFDRVYQEKFRIKYNFIIVYTKAKVLNNPLIISENI